MKVLCEPLELTGSLQGREKALMVPGLTGGVPSLGVKTAGERSSEPQSLGCKQSGFQSSSNTICVTLDKPFVSMSHVHL